MLDFIIIQQEFIQVETAAMKFKSFYSATKCHIIRNVRYPVINNDL